MEFNTYIPENDAMAETILMLWELKGGHEYTEKILPQGVIEIVFNLADLIEGRLPEHEHLIPTPFCFAQGIHTGYVIAHYSGSHHLFGIRLLPHALKSMGIQSEDLNNQVIDFTLLKPVFRTLWNQLGEAKSFRDRVKIIEENFNYNINFICPRSAAITELFISDKISAFESVDQLATEVCYSTRQLNRKLYEYFGLSAQEFINYKKFMYAVHLMHQSESKLGDISYLSGFYDQPHFNRVFKVFSDMTPGEYLVNRTPLPFHLFQ